MLQGKRFELLIGNLLYLKVNLTENGGLQFKVFAVCKYDNIDKMQEYYWLNSPGSERFV